ncbi:MAG: branched-chain amino acid aminotransferase, partial [Propionibacteriaceae bacterium]|nr:branched-chain amino acid aminotransferase [Propionibacteriaceae bacterium]
MSLSFAVTTNPSPATAAEFDAIMANPGFGDHFTDHMAVATWTKDAGWSEARIQPYGPFLMDPATAVLHYAQEIFEGLKAYRHADDSIWLFRPQANAARLNASAARMMLPSIDEADFLAAITELIRADLRWVPAGGGEQSLYLRPFMFASEVFLGVRASQRVTFSVIASPVGSYFPSGVEPVDIWVTDAWARAGIGGTGAAKCGGNYAASLIAQYEGYEHGCSQVLFIEAAGRDRIEELGGMNV